MSFCSVSERPSKEKRAQVCPRERATSKIWSFWLRFVAPAASSANLPTCQQCCSTMIPAWRPWRSWSSWMTTQMPTYTERIPHSRKICLTTEGFFCMQYMHRKTNVMWNVRGCTCTCCTFIKNNFTNLNIFKCFIIWCWHYFCSMDDQH